MVDFKVFRVVPVVEKLPPTVLVAPAGKLSVPPPKVTLPTTLNGVVRLNVVEFVFDEPNITLLGYDRLFMLIVCVPEVPKKDKVPPPLNPLAPPTEKLPRTIMLLLH